MTDLTPEEAVRLAEMRDRLRAGGYVEVDGHKRLRCGARVRHGGHQWPEAYWSGSGEILALAHKPDSAWSRSWGMSDVEVIVAWDRPTFGSRLSQVAQYHVEVVESRREAKA